MNRGGGGLLILHWGLVGCLVRVLSGMKEGEPSGASSILATASFIDLNRPLCVFLCGFGLKQFC